MQTFLDAVALAKEKLMAAWPQTTLTSAHTANTVCQIKSQLIQLIFTSGYVANDPALSTLARIAGQGRILGRAQPRVDDRRHPQHSPTWWRCIGFPTTGGAMSVTCSIITMRPCWRMGWAATIGRRSMTITVCRCSGRSRSRFGKSALFKIRRPNRHHWFNFPIGRTGFRIGTAISTEHEWIRVGLNIRHDADKAAFDKLFDQKAQIETEFGETLDWQRLPGKMASRVTIYRNGSDLADQNHWDEFHAWMLDKMERFRGVFADRVKHLLTSTAAGVVSDEDEASDEDDPWSARGQRREWGITRRRQRFDINTVSPPHDVGGMTAFLAASCLHQFLILLCKQLRLTQPW
jgi:Domain of unknown function (DUF4268)